LRFLDSFGRQHFLPMEPTSAQAPAGAARRRRAQHARATSRHVAWLTSLLQAKSSHHTGALVEDLTPSEGQLARRITQLEEKIITLEKLIASLEDKQVVPLVVAPEPHGPMEEATCTPRRKNAEKKPEVDSSGKRKAQGQAQSVQGKGSAANPPPAQASSAPAAPDEETAAADTRMEVDTATAASGEATLASQPGGLEMRNSLQDKERETEQENGRQPQAEEKCAESVLTLFRLACDEIYDRRHDKKHQAEFIHQITAKLEGVMGPNFVPEAVLLANRWAAGEPRTLAGWAPSL